MLAGTPSVAVCNPIVGPFLVPDAALSRELRRPNPTFAGASPLSLCRDSIPLRRGINRQHQNSREIQVTSVFPGKPTQPNRHKA